MLRNLMIPLAVLFASGAAHPAELDQWCATQATRPSSIVICANPDLRSLAVLRNKLFKDAQERLDPDQYQALLNDQSRWIKSYTANCGVSFDGPPVAMPIPAGVIDCYKDAGRQRVAYLIDYLTQQVTGYQPPQLSGTSIDAVRQAAIEQNRKTEAAERAAKAEAAEKATKAKAEQERQQAALAAEHAREQLRAQALAERGQKITAKLNELGFQVISPIDLELDWRDLAKNGKKVALWGVYGRVDEVDGLALDSKNQPLIPALYGRRVARRPQGNAGVPRCRRDRLPDGIGRHSAVLCRQQEQDQRARASLSCRTGRLPAARGMETVDDRAEVDGSSKLDPVLDIVAEVSAADITAQVVIGGFASAPTLTLRACE